MEQLQVILANDIIYVHGTVNGIEATFTLVEIGLWSAVVDKAEDYKYVIVITAYNSLGTPTTYEATMYKFDGYIPSKFDWTKYDYYNAEDLVRVESNTQFIADELTKLSYIPNIDVIKTDWDEEKLPYRNEIKRVERNIDALKECFYTPIGWQNIKDWDVEKKFNYLDAIRFEQNLHALLTTLENLKANMKYSGTFASGQEVVL